MFIKFKKWLSGDINWQEEKELRKAAKNDPLIADAMEGYEQFPESSHSEKIHQLNKRIRERTSSNHRLPIPMRAIAATLLFVVTVGMFWFINQTAFHTADKSVAQQQPVDRPAPIMDMPVAKTPSLNTIEETPSSSLQQAPTAERQTVFKKSTPSTQKKPVVKNPEKLIEKYTNTSAAPVKKAQKENIVASPSQDLEPEIAQVERSRRIVSQSKSRSDSEATEEGIAEQAPPLPTVEEEKSTLTDDTDAEIISQSIDPTSQDYATYQNAERSPNAIYSPFGKSRYDPNQQIEEYLQSNLQYPEAAKRNGIKGIVQLQYKANKRGKIKNVKVLKGLGYGCDEEAIRLLNAASYLIPSTNLDTVEIKFDY